jgi:hypothetical protein
MTASSLPVAVTTVEASLARSARKCQPGPVTRVTVRQVSTAMRTVLAPAGTRSASALTVASFSERA